MPGPHPARLDLTTAKRAELEVLTRRPSTGQQGVVRARIILAAAEGRNNCQIARAGGVARETVRLWRPRWRSGAGVDLADGSVSERLADAPRAGRPARITAEQFCQMVALACTAATTHGRPIRQWTGREIAAELINRGIGEPIATRHAARLVKRGTGSRIGAGPG